MLVLPSVLHLCGLSLILGGTLHDEALAQASMGVQLGGLGLRRAVESALPSYIASKVAARRMISGGLTEFGYVTGKF